MIAPRFRVARSHDTPIHRLGAFLAAFVAVAVLSAPSDASQIRVAFDDKAAEAAIDALARTALNDGTLSRLVRLPGYELVVAQRVGRGTAGGSAQSVTAALREEIRAAAAGETGGGTFVRAKQNRAVYREALREFRRVSGRMEWQVTARLNEMLPPSSDFRATAYIVVGGDVTGFAFSHRDDIVIRLDDFVGGPNGQILDVDRLAATLAHELFHVGFRAAGGLAPRAPRDEEWRDLAMRWGPDVVGEIWRGTEIEVWDASAVGTRLEAWVLPAAWQRLSVDRYISGLSRLMNEGCAVYAEIDLRSFSGSDRLDREHEVWISTIESDMRVLDQLTHELVRGGNPGDLESMIQTGLANNGPLYRVGFAMAQRIDTYTGRRALLTAIEGGPLKFFQSYFATHPYGAQHVGSLARVEIDRLIRDVEAVAVFDPEA